MDPTIHLPNLCLGSKDLFPQCWECCQPCQQTALSSGPPLTLLMWRSTSPQVMPTPRVSLHPRPSPPRGKKMVSSPNSDRLPGSEFSGAWLRPCLRLYYSPTSPSTPVLLPSFLSLPRADPMPIVDIPSSQSVLALDANISGTPLKSKSTFFLLKMPFKSLRTPCDIFQ